MPFLNLDPSAATAVASTVGAPAVSGEETLDSFRSELTAMLGGRADVDPARLDRWINQAYRDLATSFDIPSLNVNFGFALVGAQAQYLLPVTLLVTRSVSVSDTVNYPVEKGRPLRKIELDTYRKLPELSDEPTAYLLQDKLLAFYGTPPVARTVSVDAYIKPQKLALVTDSSILGAEWDEPILLSARAKAHNALLEWTQGSMAENAFLSRVRRMRDVKADERTNEVAAFRPARSMYQRDRLDRHTSREDF